jgi:ribosomal protein S27E
MEPNDCKNTLTIVFIGIALALACHSCGGCAMLSPEGEASFWSAPADWPGVKP